MKTGSPAASVIRRPFVPRRGGAWPRQARRQAGVAAVEFAIVAAVLFTLLFGILEVGRVMYMWNAAAEGTRLGARVAAVCDVDATVVKTRVVSMLPILSTANVQVNYLPAGCDSDPATGRSTCASLTVSIAPQVNVATFIPAVPLRLTLPPFTTVLPRESLDSAGGGNPVCQ